MAIHLKAVRILFFAVIIRSISYGENPGASQVENDTQKVKLSDSSIEPHLVSGKTMEFPTVLLKKGVTGKITAQLDIDTVGVVEKCTILKGLHPLIDSIACKSIAASVYSPAYENGHAVPSTVNMQIEFDPDTIVMNYKGVIPDFDGFVLDNETKTPIKGALVNIQYKDSSSDTSLSIGFDTYLTLIGKNKKQTYHNGILSTTTDSTGHFSFRFLPAGVVAVSVSANHFEIAQFHEQINCGIKRYVNYYLNMLKNNTDSIYNITVTGKRRSHSETIDIEKEFKASGMTHYLNKILLTKSTINQVPEAGSAMLVRSGSPYDNRYLIAGVPLLSPYHFGGYPYVEVDGVMLSALKDVTITTDQIAGRFPDVSGVLIEASPGIVHTVNSKSPNRPELNIDYNTIGQDFLLSVSDKSANGLQLGYSRGETFTLKWLKKVNYLPDTANINIGTPLKYGNFTLNGKYTIKNVCSELFSWLAYDKYQSQSGQDKTMPWGMAGIKIHPVNNNRYLITTGGSHQYFTDGKRVGYNSFQKKVELTNYVVSLYLDSIVSSLFTVNITGTAGYDQWDGKVDQRDIHGLDTLFHASGKEISGNLRTEVSRQIGSVELVSNLLLSGVLYNSEMVANADLGLSAKWQNDNFSAECNIGQITSRPDIRGLPDQKLREERCRTYLLSLPVSFKTNDLLKIGFQPYARYQDKTPVMEPLYGVWDGSRFSSLTSYGADCDLLLKPLQWLDLSTAVSLAKAYRGKKTDSIYEWNIPLSVRGQLHTVFANERLHFFINGAWSKGLPYYDFNEGKYKPLPNYKRIDLKAEYRSKIFDHRFIKRFDVYFIYNNMLDIDNVRTYFWTQTMEKHPVYLNIPQTFEVGARLGFRL